MSDMASAVAPTLFRTARFAVCELGASDMPVLQALFDENPDYFIAINGRRPHPDEAQTEFDELPPPHLGFTRRWFTGIFAHAGGLQGVAVVVADLCAPGVWHIALFWLANLQHGNGAAAEIFEALERWTLGHGAKWLRLGVVKGNPRAERFWQRHGFVETRVREGVDTGGRVHTVRVLVKSLTGAPLVAYLDVVPRDRPGSHLP
jgi:GNAT superfamily N-acetyltransferase